MTVDKKLEGDEDWDSSAVVSTSPFASKRVSMSPIVTQSELKESATDIKDSAVGEEKPSHWQSPINEKENLVAEPVSPFRLSSILANPYQPTRLQAYEEAQEVEEEGLTPAIESMEALVVEPIFSIKVLPETSSPFGKVGSTVEVIFDDESSALAVAILAEEELLRSGLKSFEIVLENENEGGAAGFGGNQESDSDWLDAPTVFLPPRVPTGKVGLTEAGQTNVPEIDDERGKDLVPGKIPTGIGFSQSPSPEAGRRFYPSIQLPMEADSLWRERDIHERLEEVSIFAPSGSRVSSVEPSPRSPFESLFEEKPPDSTAVGVGVRGRPAGKKNKVLTPRAIEQVRKVKATEIRGSKLAPEVLAKAKRTARKNAEVDDHMIDGIRLTPRDYMMLAFLARYRVATYGQLGRAFNTSQTALRNRLPRLQRAGLVDWAWGASTKPKLWLITEAGLDTVGMDLSAPTVKWGQLRHTLGLVDLGIDFEREREVVLTEREIRAAATRHLPTSRMRSAIGPDTIEENLSYDERATMVQGFIRESLILPIASRAFGHIPDMVLIRQPYPNGSSGNISIELELTRKSISEWKTILTGYRDSPVFAEVYYFVLSPDMKRSLNSIIKKIKAQNKIKVLDFKPVDLTADPYTTGGGSQVLTE